MADITQTVDRTQDPPRKRNGWRPGRGLWLAHTVLFAGFLVMWHVASLYYPPLLLPGPLLVATDLVDLVATQDLTVQFVLSMRALFVAMAIAMPAAIVLGLIMGAYARAERLIGPYLDAMYVTPNVMLIPLFIIWLGVGFEARVAYIITGVYFPLVINTLVGVRQTRGQLTETGRAFGATTSQMFRKIYLPGSIPMIMAGIRIAVGRGIVSMITAEMFLALVGLGYLVVRYGNSLQTSRVLAMVVAVSVFGILTTKALQWLERRIAPWTETTSAG